MENNVIKYVGRCDACGQNLYEHDVYAEIYYSSGIMVCEKCFKICYGNRKRDIYSVMNEPDGLFGFYR